MPLTLAMFAWAALLGVAALPIAMLRTGTRVAEQVAVMHDPGFAVPLLLSVVFATVLALGLMNQYQRELDPVRWRQLLHQL